MRYAALGFALATITWVATSRATNHHHGAAATQDQHWNWHGSVPAGQHIEVRGVNGSVTATPAAGSEVEVTADKHGRRSDPGDVQIVVVRSDAGVTICAVYPGPHNDCRPGGGQMNTHDNDVTVDFAVRVPSGVGFAGYTVNGDAEADSMSGPAEVSTVNGSARVETLSGDAKAHTVNGSVTAIVHSLAGNGDLDFETVNGAVRLSMPAGLNADVDAETVNGAISTDFPIQVQGHMTPRHLVGRIGGGGRELKIHSVNGSVELTRLP